MCLTPFSRINWANSSLVKTEPLSVTSVLGRPCAANVVRSSSIVVADVASLEGLQATSSVRRPRSGTFVPEPVLRSPHAVWTMDVAATPRDAEEQARVTSIAIGIVSMSSPCLPALHSFQATT